MNINPDFLPWLETLIVVLLTGIIYTLYVKIPSIEEQQNVGERIIAKRVTEDYAEVQKEFRGYFGEIFGWLVLASGMFFAVNVLTVLMIDILLVKQGSEFFFFGYLSVLNLPRWAEAIIMAITLCSGIWFVLIVFFYQSRAVRLSLATQHENFFRES